VGTAGAVDARSRLHDHRDVTSQGLFLAQLCAAAFVVSLPVLVAGFAAQDKLVQGLSMGSVK
jgi:sorbitol/mannitol transport system permease protein